MHLPHLEVTTLFVQNCTLIKGKSALTLSRDLGTPYKTAYVLSHKIREAMAFELRGMNVGGEGKIVEIDGMSVVAAAT